MKPLTHLDEELTGPYFAAQPMRGQVLWFIGLSALVQLVALAVAMCWPTSPEVSFDEIPDRVHRLYMLPPAMKTGHVYAAFVPAAHHHQRRAPQFSGCMTRSELQRQMQRKQAELSACFPSPHGSSSWPRGLTLSWTINGEGRVVDFEVSSASETVSSDVRQCITTYANHWSFDVLPICERLPVRYPF